MAENQRLHLVISSLLYPAFLGAMMYQAAEKLFKCPDFYDTLKRVIVIALIIHYVLDWAYTVINKGDEEPYPWKKFLSDLGIVVCLYIAFRLFLEDEDNLLSSDWALFKTPVYFLFLTKLFALVWEYLEVWKLRIYQWSPIKKMEIGTDGLLAAAYFVVWLSLRDTCWQMWFFAAYVAIDAWFYFLHERYRQQHAGNVLEVSIVVTERSGG
jgi:hypothetical protein